jgi:mannose-6-phosphate isomerase-like protein (cupin superfamily)
VRSAGGSGGGSGGTVRDGTVRLWPTPSSRATRTKWQDRDDGSGRKVARFSDSMTQARANLWRYPAGARGKRHADKVQEETFVIVAGTPSMFLGEPAERVDLTPGSVVVVQPGTPLQIWNHGEDEATLFIVGAPPEQGGADFLPDAT